MDGFNLLTAKSKQDSSFNQLHKSQIQGMKRNPHVDREFCWEELELCLGIITKYLSQSKLGESILESLNTKGRGEKGAKDIISMTDRFNEVHHIINTNVKDNKYIELNAFFVDYYRLASLFQYSIGNKQGAHDTLDYFIDKINRKLEEKNEDLQDKNLLIERDKMLINKSQLLFWENRFVEANEIITNRVNYITEGKTDDHYLIKTTFFYCTILCYKAWILLVTDEDDCDIEADKCFLLSIKLVKNLKHALKENNNIQEFNEENKRLVKIYDQYVVFLLLRSYKSRSNYENKGNTILGGSGSPVSLDTLLYENIREEDELILNAIKFIKEILKIITKDESGGIFDKNLPQSHKLYYFTLAAYFSASVVCDGIINLENVIYYCMAAFIQSNQCNVAESAEINRLLMRSIYICLKLSVHQSKELRIGELEKSDIAKLNQAIVFLKHICIIYVNGESTQLPNFYDDKLSGIGISVNMAYVNVMKFSPENMQKPIEENINEIFVIKHICQRMSNVLIKEVLNDRKLAIEQETHVLEGLNGILTISETNLMLIVQNRFTKQNLSQEPFNDSQHLAKGSYKNLFFELITLKGCEEYSFYYCKYNFSYVSEFKLNLKENLVLLIYFLQAGLNKPALSILTGLILEITKNININDMSSQYYPFFELYSFFSMLLCTVYFKLEDYLLCFDLVEPLTIVENRNEYNTMIFNLMLGFILSKIKFEDLASVFFEKCLDNLSNCISESNEKKFKVFTENKDESGVNDQEDIIHHEDQRQNEESFDIDPSIVDECFAPAIKMFISTVNMANLKVITDFIKKIDVDLEKKFDSFEEKQKGSPSMLGQEEAYIESLISHLNCYNCQNFIQQTSKDKALNSICCTKCRRAYYCSLNCMKKDKINHSKICQLYFRYYSKINDILQQFVIE